MKFTIIILVFLSVFSALLPASAQVKMDLEWAKDIGSDSTRETVFSTVIDTKGNVIVLTRAWDRDPQATRDIFKIQKYSEDGQFLWEKTMKGNYEQGMLPGGLCVDSNDNIFFLLNTINKSFYFDTILIKCPNWESSIFKLSSTGELSWMKQIGILLGGWPMEDNTALLAIDHNNNLLLTGCSKTSDSTFKIDGVSYFKTSVYGSFFVAKFTEDGTVLWAKSLDSRPLYDSIYVFNSQGDYISIDNDNNIYVLGRFSSNLKYDEIILTAEGVNDMFLAKILPNGSLQWIQRIGGNSTKYSDWPWGLVIDNENNPYIIGYVSQQVTISGWADTSIGTNNEEIFICKFDDKGDAIWNKRVQGIIHTRLGGTIDDCPMGIVYSPKDDAIVVRSHLFSDAKIDSTTIPIDEEAGKPFVWSYSKNGDVNWIHQIDNKEGYVQFNDIDIDNEGNIYMSGYAGIYWKYNTNPLLITIADTSFSTYGSNDGILAKFSLKEFSKVTESNQSISHLSVYPNPFSQRTTIALPDEALRSSSTIQVFNVLGEKKLELVVAPKENTFIIERQGMPIGIYYYRLINDKGILGQGEFVIQ